MNKVIKVEGLGKSYRISHEERERYMALRDVVVHKTKKMLSFYKQKRINKTVEEFWALKDISFEVNQGDRIGIIGRNGAGKSTLLKILSRITEPTKGIVKIKGRVASLLEVGTGFHPELTGADNIYLNGAILGMRRLEVKKKFDEIVDFAETEKFLDTPVKRYSSGMYVRLAFAVAAHLEPEILVVDEVLAVGDAEFQKKCLGKMEDVSKNEGRTVLFVSHNMDAISRLCPLTLLLRNGRVVDLNSTSTVIKEYLHSDSESVSVYKWNQKQNDNAHIVMIEMSVLDENEVTKSDYNINEDVFIKLTYKINKDGLIAAPAINIFNEKNQNIFDSHDTEVVNRRQRKRAGLYQSVVKIPKNLLSEGHYFVGAALVRQDPFEIYFHELNVVSFTVVDKLDPQTSRGDYAGNLPGIIRPYLLWETKQIN
ncbi:MAG: hypothetical protein B6D44_00540 [Ignavibacteriales bacterium UTCHB2]|jgi:lipopolysaccharide transport system ATP-binding protein|nr:MAG: hypothetical protein B6D44_00540 [Ignavibacteriales bacterium UTCHB2]